MISRERIVNKTIIAYTDGSAHVGSKLGGIGVYMKYGGKEITISKGFSNTKTGRMEIRAAIIAMQTIKDKSFKLLIHTDSQYLCNSIEKGWVYNWEREGLEYRVNGELWKLFLEEYRKFPKGNIEFKWVKGHVGIDGNERADRAANYKQFTEYEQDEETGLSF